MWNGWCLRGLSRRFVQELNGEAAAAAHTGGDCKRRFP
jgi:hypothetical protein